MSRAAQLFLVITVLGCRHAAPRDPTTEARLLLQRVARLALAHDVGGIARELRPRTLHASEPTLSNTEWTQTAGRLRSAAGGRAVLVAHAQVRGPLATEIALVNTPEGWRVEPESLGLRVATPVDAIEQLILALERLESDAALGLLGSTLRESLVGAARERVRGLRELLPRVPNAGTLRISMQLGYGQGLFVLLKHEADGWRVDDFN